MKKVLALLMATVMVMAMTTGCNAKNTSTESQAAEEKKYVIGVSMDLDDSAYWQVMKDGLEAKAKEYGNVELKYLVAQSDSNTQNQQIESFISQGVNAIICTAYDSKAILSAVTAANEANIPFIWCDREIISTDTAKVAYGAGTDNYALTKGGVDWLVKYARDNGIKLKAVNFQGALTDEGAVNRSKAYEDAAAENPDVMEIVSTIPTNWDFDMPYGALKSALAANPEINCILAGSDGFWPPCANALKEAGKYAKTGEEGHVFFIGVDGEDFAIRALEQHYTDADMCQPIYDAAQDCVKAAVTLADGGKMDKESNHMAGDVITQENFEDTAWKAYGYADRLKYDYDK